MLKFLTVTLLAATICDAQTANVTMLPQTTAPGPIASIQHETLPVVGSTFTYRVPATSMLLCGSLLPVEATYLLIVGRSNPSIATSIGTLMAMPDILLMVMPNPGGPIGVQSSIRFNSPIPSTSTLLGVDLYMQTGRYYPCPTDVNLALGDCMKVTVGV